MYTFTGTTRHPPYVRIGVCVHPFRGVYTPDMYMGVLGVPGRIILIDSEYVHEWVKRGVQCVMQLEININTYQSSLIVSA